MVRLSDGSFLALWEEWSYEGTGQNLSYRSTKATGISAFAGRFGGGVEVAVDARLNPSGADRIFVFHDKASWVTSNDAGDFVLHQIGSDMQLKSTAL